MRRHVASGASTSGAPTGHREVAYRVDGTALGTRASAREAVLKSDLMTRCFFTPQR